MRTPQPDGTVVEEYRGDGRHGAMLVRWAPTRAGGWSAPADSHCWSMLAAERHGSRLTMTTEGPRWRVGVCNDVVLHEGDVVLYEGVARDEHEARLCCMRAVWHMAVAMLHGNGNPFSPWTYEGPSF